MSADQTLALSPGVWTTIVGTYDEATSPFYYAGGDLSAAGVFVAPADGVYTFEVNMPISYTGADPFAFAWTLILGVPYGRVPCLLVARCSRLAAVPRLAITVRFGNGHRLPTRTRATMVRAPPRYGVLLSSTDHSSSTHRCSRSGRWPASRVRGARCTPRRGADGAR